jgi:excisionase family DNA binding protein
MERVMPRKKRAPGVPVEQRALTTDDVAAALNVTRRAVQAWIKNGKLKALRIGREFRIEPQEFEAFKDRARQAIVTEQGATEHREVRHGTPHV